MWNRKELKEKAKAGVKRNYWKAVLTACLFSVVFGGISFAGGMGSGMAFSGSTGSDGVTGASIFDSLPDELLVMLGMLAATLLVVAFVVLVISIAAQILLVNPFAVGIYRFRINAVRGNGNVSDLGHGFDVNYKRNVKTMFFMELYIFLWALLFVIPGLVKAYEYRMIPYLLAENPEMSKNEAFAASKAMMKGNKWRAFVLDLSFILWEFLSSLTFGLVGLFWVEPYKQLTDAALYDALKNGTVGE